MLNTTIKKLFDPWHWIQSLKLLEADFNGLLTWCRSTPLTASVFHDEILINAMTRITATHKGILNFWPLACGKPIYFIENIAIGRQSAIFSNRLVFITKVLTHNNSINRFDHTDCTTWTSDVDLVIFTDNFFLNYKLKINATWPLDLLGFVIWL